MNTCAGDSSFVKLAVMSSEGKEKREIDPVKAEICHRLERLIQERGLNPRKVAERIGESSDTVSKWVSYVVPGPDKIIKLCDFLGISVDFYFRGRDTSLGDLSEDEAEALYYYRSLPPGDRLKILSILSLTSRTSRHP